MINETQGKIVNANDRLLQQLMDIKQSEVSFWWPLAPGWWVVFIVLIITLMAGYYFYHRRGTRRAALKELLQLEHEYLSSRDSNRLAMGITVLLRRVALIKYERKNVAGLTGMNWLKFLDAHGDTTLFTQGIGQVLMAAPYQTANLSYQPFDEQALIELTRDWIRSNT